MKNASRFIDIHCHVLPGLDDGARDWKVAEEMLRQAALDGIGKLIATTHAEPGIRPFQLAEYSEQLRKANTLCRRYNLPLTVYSGAEILYAEGATERQLDEGKLPTLAGSRYVLVEFLPDVTFEAVASAVRRLGSAGYSPVLAHVERYDCLMRHPERIHRLKQIADVIAQMDCEILLRRRGLFFARKIDKLFRLGAIDAVATDAHDIGLRRVNFADGYAALCERYGVETAERLCWRNVMKIFDSVDKRNDRVTVN